MGCGSCGTGKPGGCKSNGGCSTGGCNRLNVHDWLSDLPIDDINSQCKVVEVSFNQGSRKDFFKNLSSQIFEKGDYVTVEGVNGFDLGEVSLTGELVRLQLKKRGIEETSVEIKKILRPSNERDIEAFKISKSREADILAKSRAHARYFRLQMKLSEVEIQADGKKGTFFYTADDRFDFRELIRIFATEFKVKVEMRHHDVVDRGRVDADLRERMLDGPDAAVGGALELVDGLFLRRPLAAGAGFHQRAPHAAAAALARALDQHAVHREADAVVGVRRHPARPHGARDEAEHAAPVQAEASCPKDLPGGRCESVGHVRLLSS